MSTPWEPAPASWERGPAEWFQHREETPWYTVDLPGLWHRLTHRCKAHSAGVHGWEVAFRCICGGIRHATVTDPASYTRHMNPGDQTLQFAYTSGWQDRNSRYRGTALIYFPHVTPLEST